MITMNDIFVAKTPEKILKILDLMEVKNIGFDYIFDTSFQNIKRQYRNLDVEKQLKMAEEDVKDTLKYLEEKLNIILGDRGYLINKH